MPQKKPTKSEKQGGGGINPNLIDCEKLWEALVAKEDWAKGYQQSIDRFRGQYGRPDREELTIIVAAAIERAFGPSTPSPERIQKIIETQSLSPHRTVDKAFDRCPYGSGDMLSLGMGMAHIWATYMSMVERQVGEQQSTMVGILRDVEEYEKFKKVIDTKGELTGVPPHSTIKPAEEFYPTTLVIWDKVVDIIRDDPFLQRLQEIIVRYGRHEEILVSGEVLEPSRPAISEDAEKNLRDAVMELECHSRRGYKLCFETVEGNMASRTELIHAVADRVMKVWQRWPQALDLPPGTILRSPSGKECIISPLDTTGEEVNVKGTPAVPTLPSRKQ